VKSNDLGGDSWSVMQDAIIFQSTEWPAVHATHPRATLAVASGVRVLQRVLELLGPHGVLPFWGPDAGEGNSTATVLFESARFKVWLNLTDTGPSAHRWSGDKFAWALLFSNADGLIRKALRRLARSPDLIGQRLVSLAFRTLQSAPAYITGAYLTTEIGWWKESSGQS